RERKGGKMQKHKVTLVGAGYMAREYTKVLKNLNQCDDLQVITRSSESAETFQAEVGVEAVPGGLAGKDLSARNAGVAIVAVHEDQLAEVVHSLLNSGFKKILVEKPAGLNREQIEKLDFSARSEKAKVYVAYNRRFYTSVQMAQEKI